MIINVVGTMGAGKSTIVRRWVRSHHAVPVYGTGPANRRWSHPKIIGHRGKAVDGSDFYVVGNYDRPSGGCDGMPSQDYIRGIIRRAYREYDYVIFEGMTVTTSFGSYMKFLRNLAPRDHFFAFLHPPVEVCIERVLDRRRLRGNFKPFDPEGVRRHHVFVTRAIERAKEFGAPFVVLDWKKPGILGAWRRQNRAA